MACIVTISFATVANAANVTVYYPNWATYAMNFQPEDIPVKHVDQIIYAFGQVGNCAPPFATDSNPELCNASDPDYGYFKGVQDYKLYSSDPYADFAKVPNDYHHPASWDGGKGNLGKILNLGKPVMLSIGGWTLSTPLGKAMEPKYRAGFVQSVVDFFDKVKKYGGANKTFAGVDIDWEPNENSWSFVNGSNGKLRLQYYLNLMQELKNALPNGQNKIGIAAPASVIALQNIEAVYPGFWKKMSDIVDEINLMTYDYHGIWDAEGITNFNSALYFDPLQPTGVTGREVFNTKATVEEYLKFGVAPEKMNLGIPAYGRLYANVNSNRDGGLYPKSFKMHGLWRRDFCV